MALIVGQVSGTNVEEAGAVVQFHDAEDVGSYADILVPILLLFCFRYAKALSAGKFHGRGVGLRGNGASLRDLGYGAGQGPGTNDKDKQKPAAKPGSHLVLLGEYAKRKVSPSLSPIRAFWEIADLQSLRKGRSQPLAFSIV
jgi:hypothetical protein